MVRAEGTQKRLAWPFFQNPKIIYMNKRNKIRAGLYFGIAMAVFFIFQDLLTQGNLSTKNLIITIVSALIGGALAGLLFGWLMGLLANSKLFKAGTNISTGANEAIVFETGANHFKGVEGVGGKLYLTNKLMVFKSHKFNIQNHELSISLLDVAKVERHNRLGIFNNGLSVTTTQQTIEKFAVQQPGEWVNQIAEKKGL